ncbi:outer membrane beta-barrel family protein [Pedobacter cryoconitis]|uniref:Outer membrane receptor protein involved in Fe transport n=1 Tax=Pedobacter cryoconitis TaxID=188932 RepID=A0A7X0J440_9SPHI|nr:outer membrane beta-barrel family protein [Pedobacter cryoconitis]MBB6499286.1 outer membrane receptor protein involved in Fe transport [Pedobacter cryoconitis]
MNLFYKHATCLLITLSFISITYAQTAKIKGTVIEKGNKPVEAATVLLLHLPDSVKSGIQITDEKGRYQFENIRPGQYLIKVAAINYHRVSSQLFKVEKTAVSVPEIMLEQQINTLKEVSISYKQAVIAEKSDRTVVDVEQMNTTGDDALEVLKKAPGIHLDKDENIVMKGRTGVNVMIDGKMSYMTGTDLTAYLKSLPADVISKIELMSSPPSSFDAAGSAGIINIKLKRNKMKGMNGNLNLGAGYGKYPKANGGINLNYNTGKLSTYMRVNTGYSNSYNRLVLNRTIDNTQMDLVNLWRPITKSVGYTVGADYFLNDRHTFGIIVNGAENPYTTDGYSNSVSYDAQHNITEKVNSKNPQKNTSGNYAYNLNYRFQIDTSGRVLGVDADYVSYNNSRNEHYINTYYRADNSVIGDPVQLRNSGSGAVSIYSFKLDYVHPFSKTFKAEAGLKTSWVSTQNDVRFDSLKTTGWINAINRTNTFLYNEHINATYITATKSFKSLELKGGLRAEQTLGNGTSSSTNTLINRKYWQLFPTFFATWKVDTSNTLNAKYARRINRPNYSNLNPFTLYSDPYTAIQGNPLLLPELSNNIELTYSYKNFRVLSLNYSRTTDVINPVIYQNDQTKESISIEQNLGSSTNIYIATGSPFNLFKWWNTNNEVSMAYDAVKSPVQGTQYNSSKVSWSASTENTFTLPKDYQLTLAAAYGSPSVSGLGRTLSYSQIDFGAKKIFMHKKATIAFKLRDIFDTAKYRTLLKYNNVNTYWQNEWESRRFSLSFSYKFGNMKIKTARDRKTGTTEEQGRVSN